LIVTTISVSVYALRSVAVEVKERPLDITIVGTGNMARGLGKRPIGAGPLKRAPELEAMGLLHMTLRGSLGTGFSTAIKVLT
jgi:hypothetical protein